MNLFGICRAKTCENRLFIIPACNAVEIAIFGENARDFQLLWFTRGAVTFFREEISKIGDLLHLTNKISNP